MFLELFHLIRSHLSAAYKMEYKSRIFEELKMLKIWNFSKFMYYDAIMHSDE